jgi:hypothetical protein
MTKALAYYTAKLITTVKSLVVQVAREKKKNLLKLFFHSKRINTHLLAACSLFCQKFLKTRLQVSAVNHSISLPLLMAKLGRLCQKEKNWPAGAKFVGLNILCLSWFCNNT